MLCADLMQTLVFYVPPHDLLAVLRDAAHILGQDRHCVIARELTKVPKGAMQLCALLMFILFDSATNGHSSQFCALQVHEEFVRCSLEDAISKYSQTAPKVLLLALESHCEFSSS